MVELAYTAVVGALLLFVMGAFVWAHVVYDREIEKIKLEPLLAERGEDEKIP